MKHWKFGLTYSTEEVEKPDWRRQRSEMPKTQLKVFPLRKSGTVPKAAAAAADTARGPLALNTHACTGAEVLASCWERPLDAGFVPFVFLAHVDYFRALPDNLVLHVPGGPEQGASSLSPCFSCRLRETDNYVRRCV